MKRILGLTLATFASAIVIYVAVAPDPEGTGPGHSSERLERLEPRDPEPIYEDVLVVPVQAGRSIPPTNHVVNDPSGEDVDVLQSEVSIAVYGDTVVIGWNDGAAFVSEKNTGTGYGYSVDRGESWTDAGAVPWGTTALPFGDPTVAVTNDGQWVLCSLDAGNSPIGLAVSRGRFDGADLALTTGQYSDGGFLDKEYLDHDPALDRLYLTYRADAGRLTRSDDGGDTWTTPINIAAGTNPNGFYPTAGVDGEVYVTWIDPLGMPNSIIYCRYSSDGGTSWAWPAVNVAQHGPSSNVPPVCFNRGFNPLNPSGAVDQSDGPHRGRFYLAWTDGSGGQYDCFFAYSDDKGQTFSLPVQLNDNTNTTEQFWPQVTVGPNGRVSVGWYDRRNAANNLVCDFYCSQSVDGGDTWGPNRRVSDTSVGWCGVPSNAAPNFGDYTEVASDDRSLFCVWTDARLGGPDVIFARMDDHFDLIATGDTGSRSAYPGTGDVWRIPNETETEFAPEPSLESEAELIVASTALASLATPAEEDGLFELGTNALSGSIQLTHESDLVTGSFSLVESGDAEISLDFTATSTAGLNGIDFDESWTTNATWTDAGPGQVSIAGTVELSVSGSPFLFALTGLVDLDGAPGAQLASPLEWEQTSSSTSVSGLAGSATILHTRTLVEEGAPVSTPEYEFPSNPRPLAVVRSTPNPVGPNTRITLSLSESLEGRIRVYSVDGKLVRKVSEGQFSSGFHEIPFDGRDDMGRPLPVGGYFVSFESNSARSSGKMFVTGRQ